ncbi:MAG: hypothetical protein Q8O76_12205 [Chloroflexota bacterium]|nr:hypothetical protein [Chloroflexota bacterium]
MTEGARLSPEALQSLAQLAGLNLPPARLGRLAPRVEAFYRDVLRLEELDLEGVEPPLYFRPWGGEE